MDGTGSRKFDASGPDTTGPNLLVDVTKGAQYLDEIKDSHVAVFQWVAKGGACAEEQMHDCRFNAINVVLHTDAIHRGGGQIIPTFRRVLYAFALVSEPGLYGSVYLVEIQCPEFAMGGINGALNRRCGHVIFEEQRPSIPLYNVKAYLTVSESFGFTADSHSKTGDQAFPQCVYDHWQLMNGSPLNTGSKAGEIVKNIRKRKGLSEDVPLLNRFMDKLRSIQFDFVKCCGVI